MHDSANTPATALMVAAAVAIPAVRDQGTQGFFPAKRPKAYFAVSAPFGVLTCRLTRTRVWQQCVSNMCKVPLGTLAQPTGCPCLFSHMLCGALQPLHF